MKIRIRSNSVRIRLSKSEVDRFVKEGYIEERTSFITGTLVYAVKSSKEENLSADFVDGNITMYVPENRIPEWAATDMIGMEYNMPFNDNNHLYLLIEKDFKCIDAPVTEDQSDFYENPLKAC